MQMRSIIYANEGVWKGAVANRCEARMIYGELTLRHANPRQTQGAPDKITRRERIR